MEASSAPTSRLKRAASIEANCSQGNKKFTHTFWSRESGILPEFVDLNEYVDVVVNIRLKNGCVVPIALTPESLKDEIPRGLAVDAGSRLLKTVYENRICRGEREYLMTVKLDIDCTMAGGAGFGWIYVYFTALFMADNQDETEEYDKTKHDYFAQTWLCVINVPEDYNDPSNLTFGEDEELSTVFGLYDVYTLNNNIPSHIYGNRFDHTFPKYMRSACDR